jgi:hypothetical protein
LDHSWGRNVAEQGLGGLGATLAARLLLLPGSWWVINVRGESGVPLAVRLPPDMDTPYLVTETTQPGQGGNFPYGAVVPPDVPV